MQLWFLAFIHLKSKTTFIACKPEVEKWYHYLYNTRPSHVDSREIDELEEVLDELEKLAVMHRWDKRIQDGTRAALAKVSTLNLMIRDNEHYTDRFFQIFFSLRDTLKYLLTL